jgi:hypothetical protein
LAESHEARLVRYLEEVIRVYKKALKERYTIVINKDIMTLLLELYEKRGLIDMIKF